MEYDRDFREQMAKKNEIEFTSKGKEELYKSFFDLKEFLKKEIVKQVNFTFDYYDLSLSLRKIEGYAPSDLPDKTLFRKLAKDKCGIDLPLGLNNGEMRKYLIEKSKEYRSKNNESMNILRELQNEIEKVLEN